MKDISHTCTLPTYRRSRNLNICGQKTQFVDNFFLLCEQYIWHLHTSKIVSFWPKHELSFECHNVHRSVRRNWEIFTEPHLLLSSKSFLHLVTNWSDCYGSISGHFLPQHLTSSTICHRHHHTERRWVIVSAEALVCNVSDNSLRAFTNMPNLIVFWVAWELQSLTLSKEKHQFTFNHAVLILEPRAIFCQGFWECYHKQHAESL